MRAMTGKKMHTCALACIYANIPERKRLWRTDESMQSVAVHWAIGAAFFLTRSGALELRVSVSGKCL